MDVGTQSNKIGGISEDEFDKKEDYQVEFFPHQLTLRTYYYDPVFDGNTYTGIKKRLLVDKHGNQVDITGLAL